MTPVAEDELVVVNVLEKQVQRGQPLDQPAFEVFPLRGGDDARHRVHRPDPFDAFFLAVDGEADAVLAHGQVGHRLAAAELLGGETLQAAIEGLIVTARPVRPPRTSRRRPVPSL